jgi:FMN-dependent NADH-azoreductase
MTLLHVDSNILGPYSVSRQLSAEIVAKLRQTTPGLEVRYHDLAAEPVPPLSGAYLAAQQPGAPPPSADVQQDIVLGAELLNEFLGADIVVIGASMYNFTISAQLKAWIDRLVIAGKTFRYSETGVEGLAGGKRVIIASSRGGIYSDGAPAAIFEHHEKYLRSVFGFIGVTDIEIVRAEGVAVGPEQRAAAVKTAQDEISKLANAA